MSEYLNQRGGARIGYSYWGAMNATWPFATLKATDETITLSVSSKEYVFDRQNIQELKKYGGIFSTGLQILHTKEEYPPLVIFWTFNFKKLKSKFEELGIRVEDSS